MWYQSQTVLTNPSTPGVVTLVTNYWPDTVSQPSTDLQLSQMKGLG